MKYKKKVILIGTEEDIIFELDNSDYKILGYFGRVQWAYIHMITWVRQWKIQ